MIADGVIIAHAGVDDGAKQSMLIIAYDARENRLCTDIWKQMSSL